MNYKRHSLYHNFIENISYTKQVSPDGQQNDPKRIFLDFNAELRE